MIKKCAKAEKMVLLNVDIRTSYTSRRAKIWRFKSTLEIYSIYFNGCAKNVEMLTK